MNPSPSSRNIAGLPSRFGLLKYSPFHRSAGTSAAATQGAARLRFRRGNEFPLRGSVIFRPEPANSFNTSLTLAVGYCCFITAHAPATCGVAIEVPLKFANPPPGMEELIETPGASRFKNGALLEKKAITSAPVPPLPSPTAPTLIAEEMQAGELMAFEKPLFPEAITVAIPAERKLSIMPLSGSLSQLVIDTPPPRLRLTEAIL